MWQFFHSSSLRIIQSFLESIHYDLINSLGLSIPLGIGRGGISIRNSQFVAVSPEGLTIKLKAIVQDEEMRDLEPGNNVFPNKLLGVHIFDICQRFSFNPFSKIISAD